LVSRRIRPTKDRLIAAASTLFAERGFHASTVRDIAARAGANVAAGHYHYGSKKALYLEVLRAQFAAIRAELSRQGASRPAVELARLTPAQLEALLQSRIRVMLELVLGPPPGLHGTLMQREMCDPSEALPVIVEEFIRPMMQELELILAHVAPGVAPDTIERCACSVVGQVLFYRFTMPGLLQLHGWSGYPRHFVRDLTEHIATFSLGGLAATRSAPRRHAR
jgi:TetR/AcrR family transcriptional regulator, regulator of cefoperazone and chloramphenicol sensitivity